MKRQTKFVSRYGSKSAHDGQRVFGFPSCVEFYVSLLIRVGDRQHWISSRKGKHRNDSKSRFCCFPLDPIPVVMSTEPLSPWSACPLLSLLDSTFPASKMHFLSVLSPTLVPHLRCPIFSSDGTRFQPGKTDAGARSQVERPG